MKDTMLCNVLTTQRADVDVLKDKLKQQRWWIYPNAKEGKFSKIQARVNGAGYLIVGGDNDTKIVCIENGVLTLSNNGCRSAVRFDDPRMFVFMSFEVLSFTL